VIVNRRSDGVLTNGTSIALPKGQKDFYKYSTLTELEILIVIRLRSATS